MAETKIVVGPQPFSVGEEYPWLAERDEDGAVVTFTGKVRNHNLGDSVKALTLEHYPGMTEKALAEIVDEARNRWPLGRHSGRGQGWQDHLFDQCLAANCPEQPANDLCRSGAYPGSYQIPHGT